MPSPDWRSSVVALVRRTRAHPDIRVGSSVRGAIDLAGLAHELGRSRGLPTEDWQVGLDAALVSLTGRIRLDESSSRSPEDLIEELYAAHFGADAPTDDPAGGSPPGEA